VPGGPRVTAEVNHAAEADLHRIDPALRAAAAGLDVLEFDAASLPRERDRLNQAAAQRAADVDTAGVEATTTLINGPAGAPLTVRTYRQTATTAALPIVVYAHGGGFVTGNLDTDHMHCVELVRATDCLIISVDYRLAPENPCPAALDDVQAAFDHAVQHAAQLNADPTRIALVGRDAGAALVAGLAQRVFDAEGPPIRLQILHEPMLDPGSTRSRREFARAPGLAGRAMDRGWAHYLAEAASSGDAVPAHRTNLEGLPPSFISCAEIDPCRDEAVDYATRLLRAYVHTELHLFAAAFHGFDSAAPDWAVSREVQTLHARSLHRAFSY
jgi:acetyl esterase/lipase